MDSAYLSWITMALTNDLIHLGTLPLQRGEERSGRYLGLESLMELGGGDTHRGGERRGDAEGMRQRKGTQLTDSIFSK
jgi:hypothetical protein